MEVFTKVLNALGMVIPILIGSGLLYKYLPKIRDWSNRIIPILNSVIAFLALFGVEQAHAGLFGDITHYLSFPAKAAAAVLISYISSSLYDKFLYPLLPAGSPLAK